MCFSPSSHWWGFSSQSSENWFFQSRCHFVSGSLGFPDAPMVDSVLSAFCNHRMTVKRAFAREAELSFSTFSFNDSEFHLFFLQWPIDCSKRANGLPRRPN